MRSLIPFFLPALLLVGALLFWLIASGTKTESGGLGSSQSRQMVRPLAPANSVLGVGVAGDEVALILAKPVFRPDRQRPVPQPATPHAVSPEVNQLPPLTNYRVVGLVVAGHDAVALVQALRTGQTLSLVVGDELDGWRVTSVSTHAVQFEGQGVSQSLAIPRADGTPDLTSTAQTGTP